MSQSTTGATKNAPKKTPRSKPPISDKHEELTESGMTHRQVLQALSGLLLGMFVSMLASTVVSTSLPLIIGDLKGDQSAFTWVVEARDKLAFDGDGDLVGAPLAGITARIRATAAGDRHAGEVTLAGPSLMAGYLDDLAGHGHHVATEHRSGDLGYLDDDGRIVLVGRSRDMIIRGTANIYPALHEPRIAGIDGVEAAVLVGVQQEDGDERVVLVVTAERASGAPGQAAASRTEPAGRLTADHPLLASVRARLPEVLDHGALPDVVLLAERIPLAGRSRKPDRRALALAVAPVLRTGS